MRLVDRALRAVGLFRTKSIPAIQQQWGLAKLDLSKKTDITKPYAQHSWVYACISDMARKIGSVPHQLYTGPSRKPRLIEDGELYEVWNRPNELDSGSDLRQKTVAHLMLGGNAVWLLDRPNYKAIPKQVWCLPHTMFAPTFFDDNWNIKSWTMKSRDGKKEFAIAPWNVIFFRLFNPYHDFWGQPPLEVAKQAYEQDWLAVQLNRSFFENGAIPGGVLKLRNAGPTERDRYQKWFDDKYVGAAKAFKTLVLNAGDADFERAQLSHADMQFIALRKMSREEICGVFHVPPSEITIQEKIHKATDQNVTRKYWSGPLKAIMRLMSDALDSQFFHLYDRGRTWNDFDLSDIEALQEDEEIRVRKAAEMWRMGVPFKLLNERYGFKIPDFPGADQSFLPIGVVPSDQVGALYNGRNGKTPEPIEIEEDEEEPKAIAATGARLIHGKSLLYTPEQERRWIEWVRRTKPLEREFERELRDYLNDARNDVRGRWLELMASYLFVSELLEEHADRVLDLPAEFDDKLKALAGRYYKETANTVGPLIEEHINAAGYPFVFEVEATEIARYLATKESLIVGVNDRIKDRIREALSEAAKEQQSTEAATDSVLAVFKTERSRAAKIAQTEIAQAAMGLEYQSELMAGVKLHQWVAAMDERTRASHVEMHMLGPWPVGKVFPNGCLYPSDMNGPPEEVVNCRCMLEAVA